MNVTLSNEQIEKAVQAAIFESITQDQRDLLIKGALQHLLTAPPGDGYSKRRSPIQEAFDSAVGQLARKIVAEHLENNADFKAALDGMITDTLARFMAAEKGAVVGQMADALTKVFVRDRY